MTLLNTQNPHFARIETLAHERGFDSAEAYILALIDEDDEDENVDPLEGFRQGWTDMLEGRVFPVDDIKRRAKQNDTGSSKSPIYESDETSSKEISAD